MKYISTRCKANVSDRIGEAYRVSSKEAVIKGLSGDGGLFVPENIPEFFDELKQECFSFNQKDIFYQDVALSILEKFFDDYDFKVLRDFISKAYSYPNSFSAKDVVPIKEIKDEAYFYGLELYHGKTSAFKDVALSLLPYLMTDALKGASTEKVCVLAATSGDTGKAALSGFANVAGTKCIAIYPKKGISDIQRLQMETEDAENCLAFEIDGNFDDAQKLVKETFSDRAVNEELKRNGWLLSSANSINIGRLFPQVVYYVYSHLKLLSLGKIKEGEEVNTCVPTGNFGNVLAAYIAKKIGVPIGKLLIASNENNVLTEFFNTGIYDANRDLIVTNSPSMDIIISSNLERYLYFKGLDVNKLMRDLREDKRFEVSKNIFEDEIYAGSALDSEVLKEIDEIYKNHNYLIDTHSAVAFKVAENYVGDTGDKRKILVAETASPYKFPISVSKALGIFDARKSELELLDVLKDKTGVEVPKELSDLKNKKVNQRKQIEKGDKDKIVRAILR